MDRAATVGYSQICGENHRLCGTVCGVIISIIMSKRSLLRAAILACTLLVLGAQFGVAETVGNTTVQLPGLGQVTIDTSAPVGGFPTLTIRDAAGKVLISKQVGADRSYGFRVLADEDATKPLLRFAVFPGPSPDAKAILAVAMFAGGSDCGYEGIVLGDEDGRITNWTPTPVFTNVEGGMYLGDLGGRRGYGLAVWGFIWGKGEAHFQAHRYKIDFYRFDSISGKMVKTEELTTKNKYETEDQALGEFGLHYANFLRSTRDFGC